MPQILDYRIMTLGHIVSSTSVIKTVKDWFKDDAKDNAVDGNQVLDEHGIDMIKRWQKSAMVSGYQLVRFGRSPVILRNEEDSLIKSR